MGFGTYQFGEKQRTLIHRMDVADMIELFSISYANVADFLYALHKQPKQIVINTRAFDLSEEEEEITVGIQRNVLSVFRTEGWVPLLNRYRLLGIYISEHLQKNPFLFNKKPENQKPRITIIDLFFEMSLSELGRTNMGDIMNAEVIPPRKERALRRAIERSKKRKQYTIAEIFTKMPLGRVGNLTLSEFFGAEVWGKGK